MGRLQAKIGRMKMKTLSRIHPIRMNNTRGYPSASEVVLVTVGFLLTAILVPIGMNEIVGANTTGWAAAVKTIFTVLLPLLYIIGCAIRWIPRG